MWADERQNTPAWILIFRPVGSYTTLLESASAIVTMKRAKRLLPASAHTLSCHSIRQAQGRTKAHCSGGPLTCIWSWLHHSKKAVPPTSQPLSLLVCLGTCVLCGYNSNNATQPFNGTGKACSPYLTGLERIHVIFTLFRVCSLFLPVNTHSLKNRLVSWDLRVLIWEC